MPYKPFEPTEEDRSFAHFLKYIGFLASFFFLASYFFSVSAGTEKILMAMTSSILLVSISSSRFDEHYYTLRNEGCRWAMAAILIPLLISALISAGSLSDKSGLTLVITNNSEINGITLIIDAILIIKLACFAFFTGVLFKSFRP